MTDNEKLQELAATIEENKPSTQALAVADQIIHRTSAALADVHAHAMSRVTSMREQLDELERTIVLAREEAEEHMTHFMKLVTEGEESIRSMELAVARIGDHLRK
jgi:Fe-S cluster assembly scaffold protein SufB